jgi:hypothetical protein
MKDGMIEIPEIVYSQLNVQFVGVTPLITERFGETAQRSIEEAQQGTAKSKMKKAPRDPEREFREKLYIFEEDEKGNVSYGFRAIGVKKAMVEAGGRFTDDPMTLYRGLFTIPVELLRIDCENGPQMRSDRVVIGRGTTTIAYRPEFWPWSITVPIKFSEAFITAEQILNLVRIAGFSTGIGAWRPIRNGTHGQFEIGNVEYITFEEN